MILISPSTWINARRWTVRSSAIRGAHRKCAIISYAMKITRRKSTTETVALSAVTVVPIPVKLPLPPKPEPEIFNPIISEWPIISDWNDVLAKYAPEAMIEFLEAADKEGLAERPREKETKCKVESVNSKKSAIITRAFVGAAFIRCGSRTIFGRPGSILISKSMGVASIKRRSNGTIPATAHVTGSRRGSNVKMMIYSFENS